MKKINITLLIPFLIIPLFYIPSFISDDYLIKLTREDGFYENMGAIFFMLTAIAFFILALKPSLFQGNNGSAGIYEKWYFLLFGLLFVFACGEEISWGQRIFNFSTPESIKESNVQEEFNFHNLEFFHGKTADGEEKKGIAAMLEMHKLFYMSFFIFLLIIPLIYRFSTRFKSLVDKLHAPVPSVFLGILFAFNLGIGHLIKVMVENEIPDVGHGVVEIKEVVIAVILFLLPLSWINFKSLKMLRSN